MKILYVANHGQSNADDEGCISFCLEKMGHTVIKLHEGGNAKQMIEAAGNGRPDLLLFHKWDLAASNLAYIRGIPRVFWYFDLVEFPDPTIEGRNEARRVWMHKQLPLIDLGFCTDGDWVAGDLSGKLHWLPQGADDRIVRNVGKKQELDTKILFTGINNRAGEGRATFVQFMKDCYGDDFHQVPAGLYGEALRSRILDARAVVCPDSPVTDRYWSNRVWNACGFGGVVFHPWCERLSTMFEDGKELNFYRSRTHLHQLLGFWATQYQSRYMMRVNAKDRVLKEHLYSHRVASQLATVKERLGVG